MACIDTQLLKPLPQGISHAALRRPPCGTVDKDVDKLTHGADGIDATLKDGHLVGDAGATELVDAEGQLRYGRVGDGGEVIGVGVDG